ncbi:MAG: phage major capsid protein [Oscillospiraceae bacterium]|nr:phage major capsid protein [Oscillospiraceae bacterium]MBQ9938421.1 phage major capsid protein [Oscillospiraceae bacterium]
MSIINKEAAETLIQEQLSEYIAQDMPNGSIFMRLARRLPNMTTKQTRIPVLDMLPMAYWVGGDNGLKQTSEQCWDNVTMTAAELAVIIPMSESVIDDADFDIMGEIKPRIIEAIGKRVDEAVIFGIDRPAEWSADIITRARQAGNNVSGATVDYDTLLGENGVISMVEQGGYLVNGGVASVAMRAKLRSIKDGSEAPLFKSDITGPSQYSLDGAPLYFPLNGSFDTSSAQLVVGDWSQAVYSIRQDVTVKLLDQGVIQDPATKDIVYNLAQQDMVALRVVFRMGWALPNYATRMNSERTFCPFAYIEPTTPVTTTNLTVKVTDADGAAVAGAYAEISGARVKTNDSGEAVFSLLPGDYTYSVKKRGLTTKTGDVTVTSQAATITVTLM